MKTLSQVAIVLPGYKAEKTELYGYDVLLIVGYIATLSGRYKVTALY